MKRLLLDANVTVLHLVGLTDRSKLGRAKRVKQYDPECMDILSGVIDGFGVLISTPNILTEVSNLVEAGSSEIIPGISDVFERYCSILDEIYSPSASISKSAACLKFGLSDAVVFEVASEKTATGERATVVTDDHKLYSYLVGNGLDAINFSHLRTGISFQGLV